MSRKAMRALKRACLYLMVIIIVVIVAAPFAWLVISSISTKTDLLQLPMRWFPEHPTLENYEAMLLGTSNSTTDAAAQFLSALKNSAIITVTVTAISLLLGVIASYAYSRFRFRGKKLLLNLTLFTQMIPPIAIIIPMYMIMLSLGLLDKRWSLIIVYLSFVLPFLVWIMKGYIDGIPTELEEAAMIDGCGRIRAFVRVVLPIASAGLAATTIFAFIISWNEFFYALNLPQKRCPCL